jgi:broad specificity phosphatase PhoE
VTVLHLVRHGESEANVERVFDGRDRPLTALGRRQAEAAATWLARAPVDELYSSPYRRARETAARIAARAGREVEVVPELEEVKVGELAGRSDEESRGIFERVYSRWLARDPDVRFPGGESLGEACARFALFLARVAGGPEDRTVVAVGHGGMPETVLPVLLGLEPGVSRAVGHAAITTLRLDAGGAWVADAGGWGSVEHLAALT